MTDPAIEAARKAVNGGLGFPNGPVDAFAIQAAREALKPIRDVLDKLAVDTKPPCNYATQIELFEKAINDISELCFATGEMERL